MKIKVEPGLLFAIPLGDGTFGFGQILAWQDPIYYMAAFKIRSLLPEMERDRIEESSVVLLGNFFDVLLKNKRWTPLYQIPIPRVPFPCYKIKVGETFYVENWDRTEMREASSEDLQALQPRSNYGPIILENALNAYLGIRPWEAQFDPLKIESVAASAKRC